jgi:hypothetical protein
VTYETVISELFTRFPDLAAEYRSNFSSFSDEEPLPYEVFGSWLIPALERALEHAQTERVAALCAYLEDVSLDSPKDAGIESLLKVEIGEWLGYVANEDQLYPFLGEATKQVCQYIPGLATQRRTLAAQDREKSPINWLKSWFK